MIFQTEKLFSTHQRWLRCILKIWLIQNDQSFSFGVKRLWQHLTRIGHWSISFYQKFYFHNPQGVLEYMSAMNLFRLFRDKDVELSTVQRGYVRKKTTLTWGAILGEPTSIHSSLSLLSFQKWNLTRFT